ncbi:MAG TPA: twin-arginine translocation signal domain-containing protein [Patescibacteria group bacterium]|nr:twin-arginine translocation signal domain-containing protein [Patescibacteria group bacterium]
MDNTHEDKVTASTKVENPGRRRLLKFLAAGGAVTAVSMLPGKWSSPSLKTGVLPAHAQVTPGRFEVRCNPQYGIDEDEGGVIYNLSATAWDTISNLAVPGVSLTASIPTSQGDETDTAITDANGVADFQVTVAFNETVTGATVTFTNQNVYGTDSCTIDLNIPS